MTAHGTTPICMDCYGERFGTKASTIKYLEIKELDYTLKSLKIQCDEKAEQLRDYNFKLSVQQLIEGNLETQKLIDRYLRELKPDEEERKALENIQRHMEEQVDIVEEANMFMSIPIKRKKKVYA